MDPPTSNRKYNGEEKRQLIANLDIEVAHRTRQFEAWLTDRLENFAIHQEGQVSRIPKQVRSMTMREFGEKYQGNVQAALRGFQKERLAAAGGDSSLGEIDKSMRKRKWVANQEVESETSGSKEESLRATKNARTIPSMSPKKVPGSSTGPGTAQRARLQSVQKTPSTSRTMGRIPAPSPSPQKQRPPFNASSSIYNPRPPSRPTSPVKNPLTRPLNGVVHQRVPSTSNFNPTLPPKTPAYPAGRNGDPSTAMRLPRKDENMLSVNGSPLANPYEFGLGWFRGVEMGETDDSDIQEDFDQGGVPRTLKRTKSSIIIRRDPSVAMSSGLHSRTVSQTSFYTASSQTASSLHSRDNSQSHAPIVPQGQMHPAFRFPSQPQLPSDATPRPPQKHTRSFSAMVAIPTKDGHVIEFDPLQTSPGALDALEGITDSAKKQARMEMGRLVQAAVDKWKIG
ncbi:hypothetical protein BDQ12DRAFT_704175 [Crucibulum laeve]|uniref:Borealin N-terminal domain-containing protein n=1 Tax=Crucibulum laeve TaxID=68775 RepID=A0A5C3M581_9AGAR|nr:hypothetical protein BDQ12DRAFT_704175 [Crucibulum laeve]